MTATIVVVQTWSFDGSPSKVLNEVLLRFATWDYATGAYSRGNATMDSQPSSTTLSPRNPVTFKRDVVYPYFPSIFHFSTSGSSTAVSVWRPPASIIWSTLKPYCLSSSTVSPYS